MHLDILKSEIETLIKELDFVMKDIQKMDAFVQESEDPDAAMLIAGAIMKKATQFETIVEKIRIKLSVYIEKQRELKLPVDFSYIRLLNEILKG